MFRTVWRNDEPPDPADFPCIVCGQLLDDCICPECPVCGTPGDPGCYPAHGLVRSLAQVVLRAEMDRQIEEEARREALYYEELYSREGL
jgi:hypothetical protein